MNGHVCCRREHGIRVRTCGCVRAVEGVHPPEARSSRSITSPRDGAPRFAARSAVICRRIGPRQPDALASRSAVIGSRMGTHASQKSPSLGSVSMRLRRAESVE